ncbi:MAG: UTP--glucose-1-phosphate uridylyltransferase GalU [Christensenellaceae bacterium]|nr:UTP--glucose-1-phosphate uridylyltransferase GalU [Christensenellaceae bacterium]
MKVKKIVIPAAGLGTRFLPATKAVPKEMLPIVDKPTLQYIIEEAVAAGAESILIITGRDKQSIENHFDISPELEDRLIKSGNEKTAEMVRGIANMTKIFYIRQKETKGLGHAILCAKDFVGNEPFGIMLGDDIVMQQRENASPAIRQLMDAYEKTGSSIVGVQNVPHENVNKYGIVSVAEKLGERLHKLADMVEKPPVDEAPSDMAILGRYVVTPAIFTALEETGYGKGGELQLTDALKKLMQKEAIYAYEFEGRRYDVGDKQGYLEATVETALSRPDLREKFAAYIKEIAKTL